MERTSVATGTELIDDHGGRYQLRWTATTRRDAAREIKRGARIGVLLKWGPDGRVDWPSWADNPPRGSTREAEQWLERYEPGLGSNVEYTIWARDESTVLLAWDAC